MNRLAAKHLLLVVTSLLFSLSPLLHCSDSISKSAQATSNCHTTNDHHEKKSSSEDEEKSPLCCLGVASCCIFYFETNQLSLAAKAKNDPNILFLEDWPQSRDYSLPWKPPKQS